MTKHASGRHGRLVGRKAPKAGWPAPAKAWCYRCQGSHHWEEGCRARGDEHEPALAGQAVTTSA
jgi:hypothetical protein